MVWVGQESFASGEISPSVFGLVSSSQYRNGCQTLTNALLTPTGAAKKRHGTVEVSDVTGPDPAGLPAALFSYFAKGRQYVVQFVSQDDDAGDLNTSLRQVRVLDAVTRAFINVGDNLSHGPFDSFGDTTAYHHHFTASQLGEVYSYQDNERIYFCHPDLPPLFLEREVVEGGVERWKYGVTPPPATSPRIIDYQIPSTLTHPTSTTIEFSTPQFEKEDEGSFWRLGGPGVAPQTNLYGGWFRADTYRSATTMEGAEVYGAPFGVDNSDWTGPYLPGGAPWTVTLVTALTVQNSTSVVDWSAGPTAGVNWVGLIIVIAAVPCIVIDVSATNQFTVLRLGGGATLGASPTTHQALNYALGADPNIVANQFLETRPYFKKHPIKPSNSTGTVTLTSSSGFLDATGGGHISWLPDQHHVTFDDDAGLAVGGTVHLNGGIIALTGVTTTAGPGSDETTYQGKVVKTLAHVGPSMQWGLGMSNGVGFPACGGSHQGRNYFGGFKERPTRLIGSRVFARDDYLAGPNDADPIAIDLSDPLGGRINWMESSSDLLVGTATAEFSIGGRPLTPSNLAVERQSGFGSRNVRPQLVGSSAVFVDGGGKGLREMTFSLEADRYDSPDLTDLAKHLFENIVIKQIAYVTSPETILYVLDTEGVMYAFSYFKRNGVAGWSKFEQAAFPVDTNTATEVSTIETMCVVRADGVNILKDEVWLVRDFKVGGAVTAGSQRFQIELMSPDYNMDASHLDVTPAQTTCNAGLNYRLLTVSSTAQLAAGDDFVYLGDFSASVTGNLDFYPDLGVVPIEQLSGIKIRFNLVAVTPHVTIPGEGDTQGRLERVTAALILLRRSRGGTAGDGVKAGTLMPPGVVIPNQSNAAVPIAALNEWRRVVSVGVHGSMARLEIIQTEPYHFEVGGINFQMTFGK